MGISRENGWTEPAPMSREWHSHPQLPVGFCTLLELATETGGFC